MHHIKSTVKKQHPIKAFLVQLFTIRAGLYVKQERTVYDKDKVVQHP